MTNPVPPAQRSASPALGTPSRTRYFVIVFAVALAVIQYIDRVAISQAAPLISEDLSLDKEQMGWCSRPSPWPTRSSRSRPAGWAIASARAGADPRRAVVVVLHCRDRLGLELGARWSPSVPLRRRRSRLLPEHRRGPSPLAADERAGARPGHPLDVRALGRGVHAAAARVLLQYVELAAGVRDVRPARRGLGLLLSVVPRPAGRSPASQRRRARADHRPSRASPTHPNMPWAVMVSSPSLWLLWAQYFTLSYAWYFFITWFPTYLRRGAPGTT